MSLAALLSGAVLATGAAAKADEGAGSLGFKLGDGGGRLHPLASLDTHWVTNPGRLYLTGPSDLLTSARLGFDLQFPSDTLELGGDSAVSYDKYWGIQNGGTAGFTTVTGHVSLKGTVNRGGPIVLRFSEYLLRSGDPYNQTYTERLLHTLEIANLWLDLRPGGGALIITAGGGYYLDHYDSNQYSAPNGSLNNFRLLPELRISYKFLPDTAVFVEGLGQFTFFDTQPYAALAAGPQVTVSNVDSLMVSGAAGLAGAITHRINAMVKAGYGNTLLLGGSGNLGTYIGAVEFDFQYTDNGHLAVGLDRSIQPTSFFQYFAVSRFYLRWQQQLAAHTQVAISPQYDLYDYGQELISTGNPPRHDRDVVVDATLSQAFAEWLKVSLVERVDYRVSNYTTAISNAGYFFNDIMLRIEGRY